MENVLPSSSKAEVTTEFCLLLTWWWGQLVINQILYRFISIKGQHWTSEKEGFKSQKTEVSCWLSIVAKPTRKCGVWLGGDRGVHCEGELEKGHQRVSKRRAWGLSCSASCQADVRGLIQIWRPLSGGIGVIPKRQCSTGSWKHTTPELNLGSCWADGIRGTNKGEAVPSISTGREDCRASHPAEGLPECPGWGGALPPSCARQSIPRACGVLSIS